MSLVDNARFAASMRLADLAVDPRDEAELQWRFLWGDGEMSEPSNFEAMRARLEAGGRTGGKPIMDIDERRLAAAGRGRRIDRVLALLSPDQRLVLFAAFGPPSETQTGSPLRILGRYPGAALVTGAAVRAWQSSGTDRDLADWLARLCSRVATPQTGSRRERRADNAPADRSLVLAIRRESDALVLSAMRAYSAARRTQR